jgi:predicted permease
MRSPPPLSRSVLSFFADGKVREDILENLQEEFQEHVRVIGEPAARRWYRGQVFRSIGPLFWWRLTRRDAGWRTAVRNLARSSIGKEAQYALRSLLGTPGFSLVVILTFSLGIGANTAVFSLVHSLILEPLPFPGGDRMVQLWRYEEFEGQRRALFPPAAPMVAAWQESEGVFQEIGGYTEEEFHLTVEDGVVSVMGVRVSPEILSMVSATPLLGRSFGEADAGSSHGSVALLSEEIWENRFGSDVSVIGRVVGIDGAPHAIVGVLPSALSRVLESGFFGAQSKGIFLPLVADPAGGWSGTPNILARVEPGLSITSVQERLEVIQSGVAHLIEGQNEWFPLAISAREALAPNFRRGLWVMFGAVGIVLLIACANIATLLLVRRLARGDEMNVRLALGAGRTRLAGQLLTESFLLGAAGTFLAFLTAAWMVDGAIWIAGNSIPEFQAARLDGEAFGFAVAAGLFTVFAFSFIPLLQLGKLDPAGALARKRPRETRRPVGWTAHKSLVVVQVSLATVLVLSAGLLTNSLGRLLSVDPGLDTEGLAAVGLDLPRSRYDLGTERISFFDGIVRGLETHPRVSAVGWARFVPPRVAGAAGMVNVEGRPPPPERHMEGHAGNWVSPTYFRAVGVPFLEGRAFTQAEISDEAEVVILNRSGAERLWPDGGGGVGTRIQLDSDYGPSPWMRVVGIVPDFKAWWLGDRPDRLQIYLPVSNIPPRSGVILVRASGDLGEIATLVQGQVRRLDSALPVGGAFWVADAFHQSVARQRFQTFLLSGLGVLGMLLAILGVYGVLSLSVTRRTREIGVRLALGATRGDINRRVLGQGLRAVALGAAIGLGFSYLSSELLTDLLWGIEATDPATFSTCSGAVILAGLFATYVSSRRAMGIDPVEALRRE